MVRRAAIFLFLTFAAMGVFSLFATLAFAIFSVLSWLL